MGRKAEAIAFAQEMLTDGTVKPASARMLRQLLNYRGQWDKVSANKRDAQGGHFDLVAAFCIACWAWRAEGGGMSRALQTQQQLDAGWTKAMAFLDALGKTGSSDPTRDTPWGTHR